jgi:hypothetical protein
MKTCRLPGPVHQAEEPKDLRDMELLAQRIGVELPPQLRRRQPERELS